VGLDMDGREAMGVSAGSGRSYGFCGRKSRTEVSIEASLVARIWLDQRIDYCMVCLQAHQSHVQVKFKTLLVFAHARGAVDGSTYVKDVRHTASKLLILRY
jgi:hypothetical protein